jgi:hypothetical protein
LRTAFEDALWAADELRRQPPAPVATAAPVSASANEAEWEARLRPYIEKLADLNEGGSRDEAMTMLDELLDTMALRDPATRDPLGWQMFEDGMLWVCCDIAANHDDFLRTAIELFGWLTPGHWLSERDPRTVEWLRLRMKEADALVEVDRILDMAELGDESGACDVLRRLADDDLLVNVDVRHLFEAELMVGMSDFEPVPMGLSAMAFTLFGWEKDHRHLEEYHPEAWREYQKRLGREW